MQLGQALLRSEVGSVGMGLGLAMVAAIWMLSGTKKKLRFDHHHQLAMR